MRLNNFLAGEILIQRADMYSSARQFKVAVNGDNHQRFNCGGVRGQSHRATGCSSKAILGVGNC